MEWKDISIRQYQNLCRELTEKYEDELERSIGLLSALTSKPTSHYLDEMPIGELKKQIYGIAFLSKPVPKLKLRSKIKIAGRRFRFNLNMRSINAGGYIDLTELVKDKEKINDNLQTVLAVMCKEVNFWGRDKKTSTLDIAMFLHDNMKMPYVISYSGFFLRNYQKLTKGTLAYLEREQKRITKTANKLINQSLSDIGAGILH